MIRYTIVILAILQCSSPAFLPHEDDHQPNHPGFAFRITQRAIDQAIEKGLELLSPILQNHVIPDVDQTFLLGSRIKLTGTQLKRCDKPEIRVRIVENRDSDSESPSHNPIFTSNFGQNETTVNARSNDSLIPNIRRIRTERGAGTLWFDESFNSGNKNAGIGGMTFSLSGVNMDVASSAEVYLRLFLSNSEDRFDFYFTLRDTSLNLTTYVGEERGTYKLSSIECIAEGDVRLTVNGTLSQNIQNYLTDSFIQGALFGKICDEITVKLKESFESNVPQSMTSQIHFFPSLTFDYRLTEAPIFRQNYFEARHAGIFQPTNNFQNWPFRPRQTGELEDTSKMFYVFLTDYTLNTLWQSLYLGDHLKWTIPHYNIDRFTSNPETVKYSVPFKDFMNLLSPNESVTIQVTMKSPPNEVFKIEGKKLTINIEAYTAFFKEYIFSEFPTKILELETVVNCEADVVLTDTKLSYDIHRFDVSSSIIYSGNNVPVQELSDKLNSVTTPTFKGILRDVGREGITIPSYPVFSFTNLHIFEDTSGVLVVGTDYDFNLNALRVF